MTTTRQDDAITTLAPVPPDLRAIVTHQTVEAVRWRPYLNAANLVTTIGFVCGITACHEAVGGNLTGAAALILVAAVADVADGIIARKTGTAGRFGDGLDSLSDLVCFGAAPAAMLYYTQLRSVPAAGAALAITWCVSTQWRLALYLVRGHQADYVGCPAPLAAAMLTAVCLGRPGVLVTSAFAIVFATVMVSKVRFPGWRGVLKGNA